MKFRILVIISFVFVIQLELRAQSDETLQKVRSYRQANEKAIIKEYMDLLAIPNVASDLENIQKNADRIMEMMKARGIETRLLEIEGAPPAVFGELKASPGAKTIGLYVHYDGQPVDPSQWASDPWKPVLREGDPNSKEISIDEAQGPLNPEWRLYARSSGDDKAPISAILTALDAMKAANVTPSVNLKFFFEGEEEAGSPNLETLMTRNRDLLTADVWFLCDGPVHQSRKQQLYFGARGVMGLEMTVYGPIRALHSGHYGNWAPNPLALIANLLASMRDKDGKILIPKFYDTVTPFTEMERKALSEVPSADMDLRVNLGLAKTEADNASLVERTIGMPALNVRGIQGGSVGEKAANAIPTEAKASIDFRLVPDQRPRVVRELVESHIREQGFHVLNSPPNIDQRKRFGNIVTLNWEEGYPASRTPLDKPQCRAVIETIESSLGIKLIVLPSLGGSIPMYLFYELNAPVIGLPIVNHDNNQHAANENLRLQNLWDGIELYAVLFANLGNKL